MNTRLVERAAVIGTALFALTAVAGTVGPTSVLAVAVVVDLVLFVVGCIAFVLTLVRAAGRSRTEELTVGGLWFMSSTPAPPRRLLLGLLGVQVLVAFTTPLAEPVLAFGTLVPTFGLGCTGLWAALAGTFPERVQQGRSR